MALPEPVVAADDAPLPSPLVPGGSGGRRLSTGLLGLDELLGGIGELWFLTGAPGQGRSMLLTQPAARFALQHDTPPG
jgi:hypothetical protein